jgi:exoribonuclease-2
MSEGFFDRYPQCAEFAEIFVWLRSLEVSADVAAEVSRSLLWAGGRAKRKGSSGGAVEAGKSGRPRALSLEQVLGGYRLGIHISDVSSCILPGTPLDIAAEERATSIYAPESTIHMFPNELSGGKLSLVEGEPRPCVSYLISLDSSYKLTDFRITPSVIRSRHKYSYEEVDQKLEAGDTTLNTLYEISISHETERIQRGALRIQKRDANVSVKPDGTLALVEIDETTPARVLVSEMMVMANELSARIAMENKIPVIFRSQPPPEGDLEALTANIPPGPAQELAIRMRLKRSETSIFPAPHSGLGLAAYTQASSPIRRYADLCTQRQLLSWHARKEPFYPAEQLKEIMYRLESPLGRALAVSRESKRFWLQVYVRDYLRSRGPIPATVIRTDLKQPIVELDYVYLTTPIRTNRKINVGDVVQVKVVDVDPQFDYLRMELVE